MHVPTGGPFFLSPAFSSFPLVRFPHAQPLRKCRRYHRHYLPTRQHKQPFLKSPSMSSSAPHRPPPPKPSPPDKSRTTPREDSPCALAEFGRICLAACAIGLVLFFYDVLVSLVVVTIGGIYAVAVLLQVRGANSLLKRMMDAVVGVCAALESVVTEAVRRLKRGETEKKG